MDNMEPRPCVLIVNDNSAKAEFFQSRLEAQFPDTDVFIATDAYFAKQLIESCTPDVVMLDVTIPENAFNQRITSGDYTNSLSVAQAYTSCKPEGKLILLSSYAPLIGGRYPKGTVSLHEKNFDDVPGIIRKHLGLPEPEPEPLIVEAPREATPPQQEAERPVKHLSRVQAVRRSSAHNGSREGDQDSWSEQVGSIVVEADQSDRKR